MKYVCKEVKFQQGLVEAKTSEHRNVIEEMAKDGYKYVGWIPTKIMGHGSIVGMDLVFEKEE